MYRQRLAIGALVGIFLTATASAEEHYRPHFSWETVPLYAHFGAADGMSDADVEFVATHYDFIALEKNHGASQYGTTEEGTIADVARIKAINPDAKVLFYWNLLLDYPMYTVSEQRDDDASWFIHDTEGDLDQKRNGRNALRKYDLSNPEFQSWWAAAAADMLVRGSMDGVFVDAIPQVSVKPEVNQRKWGPEKYAAIENGIGETLDLLKQEIGPDTTVIYNGIRSVPGGWEHGGLKYLQHADGVIVEHFNAFQSRAPRQIAQDMDRMAQAGREGKVVILKAFPGFSWIDKEMMQKSEAELLKLAKLEITFPLAAFLIVAQEHFYFNYTWGYRENHGAYAWYPEYDMRLGPPKDDARQNGYEYWREFEHASVYINIETKQATIDWHSANDTSEPVSGAVLEGTEEYHVAITGSDDNPGTASKPLRSISAAASIAEPGDTITVHKGVYRERVNPPRGGVSADKRITYQAAAGEAVEIKGSEKVTGWQRAENDSWKLELENSFFGDFNPYSDELTGHWFYASGQPAEKSKNIEPRTPHTGAVYFNGAWLNEAATLQEALQPAGAQPVWFAAVTDTKTTIWAQFPQADPNRELTEINVRQTIFFPEQPGLNYITVRGFTMSHAATPWAPPTQKQMGLIGPHWSKGWIIEDNDISHAVTACVQLGIKALGEFTGDVHGMNAILRHASESGEWTREKVGGHIVRRNRIHECGATGINGNMGASFSLIEGNHIFDIHRDRSWSGLEQGGIKLHASIDIVIRNNVIYRAAHGRARALWIDWLAQGAVIEGNICFDNELTDLFLEVSHGPSLVANNVFLSKTSMVSTSRGAAYVNNYIAGSVVISATVRKTPYAEPHSTQLLDVQINQPLDDRFMNNIFAGIGPVIKPGFGGVTKEGLDLLPFDMRNNLYLGAAQPPAQEKNPLVLKEVDQPFELTLTGGDYSLEWNLDQSWLKSRTRAVVGAKDLGLTHVGKHPFEYADGSPVVVSRDLMGSERNALNTMPGPIESPGKGVIQLLLN